MQDLPTDTQALESTIDDYSEEYGDQKTIETLTQWLNRTQGKSYIIIKTETVNNLIADGKRSGKLDQLENLRQNLSNANLDDFNKANMYDYIMKEMVKL
jgi:Holliday junction resolvase